MQVIRVARAVVAWCRCWWPSVALTACALLVAGCAVVSVLLIHVSVGVMIGVLAGLCVVPAVVEIRDCWGRWKGRWL